MDLQEQLGPEWYDLLGPLFSEPWMVELGRRVGGVEEMYGEGALQPSLDKVFKAFRLCQPSQLKVAACGQDPYSSGVADGLAFSTNEALPPKTLRIVFQELERTGFGERHNPNLEDWARQGVFLINTILTCTYRATLSHKGWGWERFIGVVLDCVNHIDHPFVVMSWGTHAKELIKEHIQFGPDRLHLKAIHPVAESYSNGAYRFVGCGHFSKANEFLESHGMDPIEWNNPTLQVRNQEAIIQAN